ncbi:MAG TPA: glycoside hydrolase family 27 protein [Polyangia bacterium]|nr:glycoside hydrolase family 27 protein [Polyangia bacterium]
MKPFPRIDRGFTALCGACLLTALAACGSSGTVDTETGQGGSSVTGGSSGTGGSHATGGSSAQGGSTATGGNKATGGTTGTGGVVGSGGTTATGGASGGGGSGGAGAKGGTTGSGGVVGTGGSTTGTGGTAGRGGASGSGGATATGGVNGTGGAAGAAGAAGILAATPPMGWNSWNTFQCNLNETLIKQMADTFVSSGMQAVGYQYVNLDDCWMDGRDSSGKLQWNATKFPSGIPALASYVHGKGLKLGIYETPNTETCVGLYGGISPSVAVGSLGHETSDAQTFASWGVDYLKYDKCQGPLSAFATMRDALRATNRPIFYSINPGDGSGCPPNTCSINLPTIANMWRIGFDINASWSSMIGLVDQDANLYTYAAPGHWNDPDMLEVGNSGLSDTEGQTHFSMWAMLAAPLIAGNDLRSMSATTKATLTNSEVIAVDQDPLGNQGRLVASPGTNLQVWSKTLTGTNARAVALLNRGTGTASITVQWSALGIPTGAATVRDLWNHTDLGSFSGSYTASSVPSHGVVMLKVTSAP